MASKTGFRRLLRPAAYGAAGLATTTGIVTLYMTSRSKETFSTPKTIAQIPQPSHLPRIKPRHEQITALKASSSATTADNSSMYDLLIIGGGATGTGIALDATTRGLRVALVDSGDFSSGTSSKSTKLVHGGVRYLEKAVWNLDRNQYELVKEALRERKNFLHVAPHLSSWLPIMLPLSTTKWWEAPYFWAGTKFYDFLAGGEGNPSSYILGKDRAIEAFPMVKRQNLLGALVYYDGQHNDSRMNMGLAMTAAVYGATMVNHVEVTGLEKDSNGKIIGASVRDKIAMRDGEGKADDAGFVVRAKGVINATGPYADAILQMDVPAVSSTKSLKAKPMVAPSLGTHIVLPGYLTPTKMGLLDPSTSDGRVVFFLPWQGTTIAGTTDSPCNVSQDPSATEDDINWILKEVKGYLTPDLDLKRSDVMAAWAGIRPLVRDPEAAEGSSEALVRSHLVTVSPSGLLTCAGGKWTTYRQMAEDAVDRAVEVFKLAPNKSLLAQMKSIDVSGLRSPARSDPRFFDGTCQTARTRLIGAHGFSQTLFLSLIQKFGLSADVARHLAENYGDRAWQVAAMSTPSDDEVSRKLTPSFPFLKSEVQFAVQSEYAQTATDVLARRTRLSFLDVKAALNALPEVIDIMGDELNWSASRRESEWTETVYFLGSMGLPREQLNITREEVLSKDQWQAVSAPSSPVSNSNSPLPQIPSAGDARPLPIGIGQESMAH